MQETLYRRNQDGMMETVVPQAQGKAAALSAYLARGGTPFRMSGRFKKGPMKGLNVDEATAQFERMWASAPDAVKQKYASRSSGAMTDLAPSERQISSVSPTPRQGTAQTRRMASYGFEFKPDGSVGRIGTPARKPASTPSSGDERETPSQRMAHGAEEKGEYGTPAPGSDEARRIAFEQMQGNDKYATADTGDGAMRAAVAMQDASSGSIIAPGTDLSKLRPVSSPVETTPIDRAITGALDANTRFWDRTTKAVNSAIAAPFTPDSERIVGAESEAARRTLEAKRAAEAEAQQRRMVEENANRLRREQGLPVNDQSGTSTPTEGFGAAAPSKMPVAGTPVTPGMATDERMHAEGKTNVGGIPVVKAPPSPTTPSNTPVGLTSTTPARIGSTPPGMELVGMKSGVPQYAPIGEVYGQDAATKAPMLPPTAEQARANYQTRMSTPAMQAGAQRMMESAGAVPRTVTTPAPMPRGPASQPVRTGSALDNPSNAFSNAAYARTAAAEARGVERQKVLSRAVNQDDPKKFFTGRTLPLTQLVKNQKLRGIGTPALAR